MNEIRLNIRISQERKNALVARAKEENRNVTDLVIEIIDEYLGRKSGSSKASDVDSRFEKLEQRFTKLEQCILGKTAA